MSVNYFGADSTSATLSIELTEMGTRPVSAEITDDLEDVFADYDRVSVKVVQSSAGPPVSDYPFAMQVFSEDPAVLAGATGELADFIRDIDLSSENEVTEVAVFNLETLTKLDGRRFAEVKAKFSNPEDSAGLLEIQEQVTAEFDEGRLEDLNLESDALGFDFGQESENLSSFQSAAFALIVALIAMYGLLVLQFNSFLQPVLVFLAIPFSFVGLFPGLVLTGNASAFLS
ncbi:MAG: AcrB/AcrD/AcrF family protein [candidate division WS6 bacterium OLB20]|uniref:AcrB/AcrD/AcrF family protein n=1 Tax=candidate division WS6 bacterium OLB20 TaxID=1617426 RepID=A0A136M083_9BACT|nr:MAG: AcrB/AcrD/AcrF family protein [candidate division WS6 bacterium OLB20]